MKAAAHAAVAASSFALSLAAGKQANMKHAKPTPESAPADSSNCRPDIPVRMPGAITNVPQKPLTSYMMFSNDQRTALQKEMPGMSQMDFAREVGRRWRELKRTQTDELKRTQTDDFGWVE